MGPKCLAIAVGLEVVVTQFIDRYGFSTAFTAIHRLSVVVSEVSEVAGSKAATLYVTDQAALIVVSLGDT